MYVNPTEEQILSLKNLYNKYLFTEPRSELVWQWPGGGKHKGAKILSADRLEHMLKYGPIED